MNFKKEIKIYGVFALILIALILSLWYIISQFQYSYQIPHSYNEKIENLSWEYVNYMHSDVDWIRLWQNCYWEECQYYIQRKKDWYNITQELDIRDCPYLCLYHGELWSDNITLIGKQDYYTEFYCYPNGMCGTGKRTLIGKQSLG